MEKDIIKGQSTHHLPESALSSLHCSFSHSTIHLLSTNIVLGVFCGGGFLRVEKKKDKKNPVLNDLTI